MSSHSRQSMTPTRKSRWRARFSLSGSPSSTSFVRVIVDNCPAHPKVKGLNNVTLFFLPPNTTTKTQPIDQDVIRSLKHNYRKLVSAHHLISIEKKRVMEKITVLDCMHFLQQAWNNITETTIANCYWKAGFKTTDDTDTTGDIETEIEDDPLEDLPLARLVGATFKLRDYVSADDDLSTCETLTDEAILNYIIAARDVMPDDNDMTGDHYVVPVEPM